MRKKILLYPIIFLLVMYVLIQCGHKKEIVGSGMIEIEEVDISSKIAGQIKELRVDEGVRVSTGDTLIILDHKEILAQEREARAGLTSAEQTLKEIRTRKQELVKNVERLEQVYREGAVADQDLEEIKTQLEVLKTQEEKAIAGLNAAYAQVDLIQTQLTNAFITSPLAGVILSRNFAEGELALPGAIMLTIGDLRTAWLKIYVPEREIGRLALGVHAQIFVDAYAGEVFEGTVTWIASKAEFTPRNIQTKDDRAQLVFAVKVKINNDDEKLLPGMPAEAKIVNDGHN